jgi:hypothetical protein
MSNTVYELCGVNNLACFDDIKRYFSLFCLLVVTFIYKFSQFFNSSLSFEAIIFFTLEVIETRKTIDIKCTTKIIIFFRFTVYNSNIEVIFRFFDICKLIPSWKHFFAVATPRSKKHQEPWSIFKYVS